MNAALETGVAPWVRPWRTLGASGDLRNGETGRAYSGVNVMLLGLTMDAQGYADPRWITARFNSQCHGRDCAQVIRKGERAFYYPNGKRIYAVACGHAESNANDFETCRFDEESY